MRKTFFNLGILALLSTSVGAQVKDISFAVCMVAKENRYH